jgi:hypothetical protein
MHVERFSGKPFVKRALHVNQPLLAVKVPFPYWITPVRVLAQDFLHALGRIVEINPRYILPVRHQFANPAIGQTEDTFNHLLFSFFE